MYRHFFALDNKNPKYQNFMFLPTGEFAIHYVILNSSLITRIIFFLKLRNAVKQTFSSRANASQAEISLRVSYWDIFLTQLWVHNSGKECNNCNRSENRNQCNSGFKIVNFPQKIRQFWKSRLLLIPGNVKTCVPSLILVAYTHRTSALGDSSTTRYGVNNIFQRDVRTNARTCEHHPSWV